MRHYQTRPIRRPPPPLTGAPLQSRSAGQAERHSRQSTLLDQALLETFPASDPVSVMQIT